MPMPGTLSTRSTHFRRNMSDEHEGDEERRATFNGTESRPASETPPSLYDSDNYYAADARGSRLSPAFESLLLMFDRWRAQAVVKNTGIFAGRVLDVGAGDGKFLHFMQRLGFEVEGTTTSTKSARAARGRFGLRLEVSASLDGQLPHAPFDLLTYWHVFEHLEDPSSHTREWPILVRPGGFVVVEVPNIRSIGARLCYGSWLGSDEKHHINHQPPETIVTMLRELGFDPRRMEHFSTKFTYVFLWSALLGSLFGRLYDFDGIMSILKMPLGMLRRRPLWTINAAAAVGYLAPAIAGLMLYGLITGQGEVFRVYAKRQPT
jgi:SAM-dependent methyltransferase